MVAIRPCNSDASLSQQIHMAAVVSNDRTYQAFVLWYNIFTLVYQAHGQQANRRAVDQVLACLCASLPPSTSKKLVAGMPQATSGTCSRM